MKSLVKSGAYMISMVRAVGAEVQELRACPVTRSDLSSMITDILEQPTMKLGQEVSEVISFPIPTVVYVGCGRFEVPRETSLFFVGVVSKRVALG